MSIENPENEIAKQLGQYPTKETRALLDENPNTESQPWLDRKREDEYKKFVNFLNNIKAEKGIRGIQEWFIGIFNKRLSEGNQPLLTVNDIYSLRYRDVISETASSIVNARISRPVFALTDWEQFLHFSRCIYNDPSLEIAGTRIPAAELKFEEFPEIDILVSVPDEETIDHEIRHSIDPHKRKGYNHILDELFAYYHQAIVSEELQQYPNAKLEYITDRWDNYFNALSTNHYADLCAKDAEDALSYDEFQDICRQAIQAVRSVKETHGDLATQRILAQTKTLDDLFSLVKEPMPQAA